MRLAVPRAVVVGRWAQPVRAGSTLEHETVSAGCPLAELAPRPRPRYAPPMPLHTRPRHAGFTIGTRKFLRARLLRQRT